MDLLSIIPWPAIAAALGCTATVMLAVAVLILADEG
jgi:negative regulator of sigma E activity